MGGRGGVVSISGWGLAKFEKGLFPIFLVVPSFSCEMRKGRRKEGMRKGRWKEGREEMRKRERRSKRNFKG